MGDTTMFFDDSFGFLPFVPADYQAALAAAASSGSPTSIYLEVSLQALTMLYWKSKSCTVTSTIISSSTYNPGSTQTYPSRNTIAGTDTTSGSMVCVSTVDPTTVPSGTDGPFAALGVLSLKPPKRIIYQSNVLAFLTSPSSPTPYDLLNVHKTVITGPDSGTGTTTNASTSATSQCTLFDGFYLDRSTNKLYITNTVGIEGVASNPLNTEATYDTHNTQGGTYDIQINGQSIFVAGPANLYRTTDQTSPSDTTSGYETFDSSGSLIFNFDTFWS